MIQTVVTNMSYKRAADSAVALYITLLYINIPLQHYRQLFPDHLTLLLCLCVLYWE